MKLVDNWTKFGDFYELIIGGKCAAWITQTGREIWWVSPGNIAAQVGYMRGEKSFVFAGTLADAKRAAELAVARG